MHSILFLTRWYPDKTDPQNAVFIKKHTIAAAKVAKIRLVYVTHSQLEKGLTIRKHEEESIHLTEYFYHYHSSETPMIGKLINIILYLYGHYKIFSLLKKEKFSPNLVHVHMMSRPAVIAFVCSKLLKIPYFITEHWTGYASGSFEKFNTFKKRLMIFLFNQAKLITAVSPSLEEALQQLGIQTPIRILPNVVEAPKKSNDFFQGKNGWIQIGSVSDFYDEKKNVSGLILALAPLLKKNSFIQLHIVGDGPDKEKILHCLSNSGISEDQIKLYGRLSNDTVLKFMQFIDLYVCYSNIETFSVATAEALASGKPVITTKCGGPEYFVDKYGGIVIEKGNGKALREAVLKLIKGKNTFNPSISAQNMHRKFGEAAISKLFLNLYDEFIPTKTL